MFSSFFEDFAVSALLWFVLMGVFGFLFAGARFRLFINGLGRLVGSVFSSPIIYLRRAFGTVADHGQGGEEETRSSDQYLLGKLLLGLQAAIIILSLGGLSAGLVRTWNVFLPPQELRDAIKETRARISENEKSLEETVQQISALDEAWVRERDAAITAFRTQRQQTKAQADRDRTVAERQASTSSAQYTLQEMGRSLIRLGGTPSREELDNAKQRLDNIIRWNWYLKDGDRAIASNWASAWYTAAIAELDLRVTVEEDIRLAHQQSLADLRERQQGLTAALDSDRAGLENLRRAAKFNFGPAFVSLVGTVISFLALVWLLGLLLESLWLAVHLARDVRKIRRTAEGELSSREAA